MKPGDPNVSPMMKELSTYIAGAIGNPLPHEVTERAKLHLVDTFAAIISGTRLAPGKKVLAYVRARGGKSEAGKRWPAGGPIQGSLQVLRELMQQHGFKADEVEKLVARMPDKELAIVDNRDMPDICVQHLLAVMLLDGIVTFKSAHDFRRMKDPQVLALRKRVQAICC